MSHSPAIEKLDIANPEGLVSWHKRFELYCKTTKSVTAANKSAFYFTLAGKEAFDLLTDLCYPDDPEGKSIDELKDLLIHHLKPTNFETMERAKFNKIVRNSNESLKAFLLRVQQQSAKCNFGAELKTQLRDRLVAGINLPKLERKFLAEKALTYEKVKEIIEAHHDILSVVPDETVLFYKKQSCASNSSPQEVLFNKKQKSFMDKARQKSSTEHKPRVVVQNSFGKYACFSCGGPHRRSVCKFREAKCHKCGKIGHIQKVCHQKTVQFVGSSSHNAEDSCLQVLGVVDSSSSERIWETITFANGTKVNFIADTGSPISFISYNKLVDAGLSSVDIRPCHVSVSGITGHRLPTLGEIAVEVHTTKGNKGYVKFIVTRDGPCILGLDSLRTLHVTWVFGVKVDKPFVSLPLQKLISECSSAKGGMKVKPISLDVAKSDPIFCKARPMAFGIRDTVKAEIEKLISSGILEPVQTSTWATPIVTPLKANGQVRVCGDYRVTVNKVLKCASSTTPDVEEMLAGLSGSVIFSKIDLQNAFLQIPLSDKSKELTTINTIWGLYRYRFMPFGLTVAPAIFQDAINQVLNGLEGVKAYQDDIIVYASSREKHEIHLAALLNRLRKLNVRINADKSMFAVTSLPYLGYCVDGSGIRTDPSRVSALVNAPRPSKASELQSFLCCIQYYSKFIPHFSTIAEPLFELSRSKEFRWTSLHSSVRQKLVDSINNSCVLKSFEFGQETHLIVDASEVGLGAVLEQNGRPVIFISRLLSRSERCYAQTQKEALAIVWAIRRLHKFLFGTRFKIITDHKALQFIFNPEDSLQRSTSLMLQRWALELANYSYTIEHRPGKRIPNADFLSRHSKFDAPETLSDEYTMLVNPIPLKRNFLIEETRRYYGSVLRSLKFGWSLKAKRMFPKLYSLRDELSTDPDGGLLYREKWVIPPTCRKVMLEHLHQAHVGRDKMLSLAKMRCWWPELNADIDQFLKACDKCKHKPRTHNSWKPWPMCFEPMSRVHVDYCGPFLGKFYALVVIDSYSRYPEVFLTTSASAHFSKIALRKFFSREGIPRVVVSDNGTHFTGSELHDWLKSLQIAHVFSPPRHPQSNGLAENFIRSLKSSLFCSNPTNFQELEEALDNFLFQYRITAHGVMKETPSQLFKGRTLRNINLDATEVKFFRGNDHRLSSGVICGREGSRIIRVLDPADGSVHRRHSDQVFIQPSSVCEPRATADCASAAPERPVKPAVAPEQPVQPAVAAEQSVQPAVAPLNSAEHESAAEVREDLDAKLPMS